MKQKINKLCPVLFFFSLCHLCYECTHAFTHTQITVGCRFLDEARREHGIVRVTLVLCRLPCSDADIWKECVCHLYLSDVHIDFLLLIYSDCLV